MREVRDMDSKSNLDDPILFFYESTLNKKWYPYTIQNREVSIPAFFCAMAFYQKTSEPGAREHMLV